MYVFMYVLLHHKSMAYSYINTQLTHAHTHNTRAHTYVHTVNK